MVGAWPAKPYTFRGLKACFGQMWVRCDACRRFAVLRVGERYLDADYRKVHFSCSKCGGEGATCVIHPHKDGYADYRETPPSDLRHPRAHERMRLRRGDFIPPKLRWKPMR